MINSEILDHALSNLETVEPNEIHGCDLHNKLFNEDYFIVGYYPAEKWIESVGSVFSVIGEIKEYEEENFGETNTDFFSSEKVANMYAYILGEELLNRIEALQDAFDRKLTSKDLQLIKEELEALK